MAKTGIVMMMFKMVRARETKRGKDDTGALKKGECKKIFQRREGDWN